LFIFAYFVLAFLMLSQHDNTTTALKRITVTLQLKRIVQHLLEIVYVNQQ